MAQHPDSQASPTPLASTAIGAPRTKSESTKQHRKEAPNHVRVFVLTVSDTRTMEDDKGGALIKDLLRAANHDITGHLIVRDDAGAIAEAVQSASDGMGDPEAVIVTGGSGIGPRDVTPEALRPLLTKELPGFGEVFRVLSWDEVGSATILSRAFAGVMGRTLLFVLPGSTNAVRLAMEKLIVPELGHLVREIRPERRQ